MMLMMLAGQHHQHHLGPVSPIFSSHSLKDPSWSLVFSQPYPKRGLGASFQNGRAHDADFGPEGTCGIGATTYRAAGPDLRGCARNRQHRQHEEGAVERSVIQCSTYLLGFPTKTPKDHHIWPKPRFLGPEPGFGPDVVTFGVNSSQVLGPRTWVWARCGICWLFWEGITISNY